MTDDFDVFKLIKDKSGYYEPYKSEAGWKRVKKTRHSWVPLESLGNHMLFLGYNYSLSLDSRLYSRCQGNCIYFADYGYDDYDMVRITGVGNYYHDVGVYLMGEKKVKYLKFCKASSPMNMVWLTPNFSTEFASAGPP